MVKSVKTVVRDMLPKSFQVPVKYWYGWFRGGLEAEMKFLGALVGPGDRVVDVGANRGVYAYRLWKLGAQVEVFEPNPICFGILSAWAAGKPGIRLHADALSDHAGAASLHIPVDGAGVEHDASASIEHTGFPQSRDQPVQLQTLDSYQMKDVSLIKIDVEGHEYSVLGGAVATIAASQPALLIEIEQRHNGRPIEEVFARIRGLGYRGFFLESGRLTVLERFDVSRHQSMANFGGDSGSYINNFLFLHRNRIDRSEYAGLVGTSVQ